MRDLISARVQNGAVAIIPFLGLMFTNVLLCSSSSHLLTNARNSLYLQHLPLTKLADPPSIRSDESLSNTEGDTQRIPDAFESRYGKFVRK